LSGDASGAVRTALALGFGTLLWPYSKFGFNAPLTTLCLFAGVYAAWIGTRGRQPASFAWSGVWLAGAFLTRHEMAIVVPLVAIWIGSQLRNDAKGLVRAVVSFGVPLAIATVFWLWYNDIRFGNPLNSGYLDDPTINFGGPFTGLYGLLLSPGRSLFVYTPLAVAGVAAIVRFARRDRSTAVLFAAVIVALLLFYSTLSSWEGGRSYGPRYLVPVLPLLTLPLVWWLTPNGRLTRGILALVIFSAVIQIPGVLVDFSKVSIAFAQTNGNIAERRLFSWGESGLVLNTRTTIGAVPLNVRYLARGERPASTGFPVNDDSRDAGSWQPPPPDTESRLNRELGFSLDFWWLYLFYLGALPAAVAATIPVLLFGAGMLMLRSASVGPAEAAR
jgi:hypothetical protein